MNCDCSTAGCCGAVTEEVILWIGANYCSMQVYPDLMSYSGGVYVTNSLVSNGGHDVEIVGIGEMDDDDSLKNSEMYVTSHYWIVKNFWGRRRILQN